MQVETSPSSPLMSEIVATAKTTPDCSLVAVELFDEPTIGNPDPLVETNVPARPDESIGPTVGNPDPQVETKVSARPDAPIGSAIRNPNLGVKKKVPARPDSSIDQTVRNLDPEVEANVSARSDTSIGLAVRSPNPGVSKNVPAELGTSTGRSDCAEEMSATQSAAQQAEAQQPPVDNSDDTDILQTALEHYQSETFKALSTLLTSLKRR